MLLRTPCTDKKTRQQVFAEWLAVEGQVPATVPVWWSRRQWVAAVCHWATTAEGAAALKAQNVSVGMFRAVVTVMARYAAGKTGRNVAVTRERIAQDAKKAYGKCSARTVTKIRQHILAPAGWAMEAKRGEGQAGGNFNRPSIWHLLSRAVCTLSKSLNFETKSSVCTNSPSAARRRRNSSNTVPATPTIAKRPRVLHTQTLAGHLASRCLGFGAAHPGRLADVLDASPLELRAWSPSALLKALDAQMAETHLSWPDRIANPAGFLAHRLASLPAVPTVRPATPIPPRFVRQERTTTASPESRAAAIALVRASRIDARRAAAA